MSDIPRHPTEVEMTLPEDLKTEAIRRGYRFERTDTDEEIVERMIRPDGTVAVIARCTKGVYRYDLKQSIG